MRTITKRLGAIALTLAACLPMLLSCNENITVENPSEEGQFNISFGLDEFKTRSAIGTDSQLDGFETTYKDVTIFQFLVDGSSTSLEKAYYTALNGSKTVTVSGTNNATYRFYALLNCGDLSSELSVGDSDSNMKDITVSWPLSSRSLANGIPAVSGPVDKTLTGSLSFTLPCTRLASCWDFKVTTDQMTHGSFTVKSLKLCQSPNENKPYNGNNFFKNTQTSSVEDGDYASSANLTTLNAGNAVRFYTLENYCGTIITNTSKDPWKKVPTSANGVGAYLPTYIEMTGTYTDNSGDLTSEHTYRMYLGENNYDNFNVARGTKYTLTLNLTEDPLTAEFGNSGSWKVEVDETDNRNFQFTESNVIIDSSNNPYTVSVTGDDPDYGITYVLTTISSSATGYSASNPDIWNEKASFNPSTMQFIAGESTKSYGGRLQAWYWDGKLADEMVFIYRPSTATVTVTNDPLGIEIYESNRGFSTRYGVDYFQMYFNIRYNYTVDDNGELQSEKAEIGTHYKVVNAAITGNATNPNQFNATYEISSMTVSLTEWNVLSMKDIPTSDSDRAYLHLWIETVAGTVTTNKELRHYIIQLDTWDSVYTSARTFNWSNAVSNGTVPLTTSPTVYKGGSTPDTDRYFLITTSNIAAVNKVIGYKNSFVSGDTVNFEINHTGTNITTGSKGTVYLLNSNGIQMRTWTMTIGSGH